jgi:hypothetical protein
MKTTKVTCVGGSHAFPVVARSEMAALEKVLVPGATVAVPKSNNAHRTVR